MCENLKEAERGKTNCYFTFSTETRNKRFVLRNVIPSSCVFLFCIRILEFVFIVELQATVVLPLLSRDAFVRYENYKRLMSLLLHAARAYFYWWRRRKIVSIIQCLNPMHIEVVYVVDTRARREYDFPTIFGGWIWSCANSSRQEILRMLYGITLSKHEFSKAAFWR